MLVLGVTASHPLVVETRGKEGHEAKEGVPDVLWDSRSS